MKLRSISIKNFRSIKDLSIDVSPNCLVLVGMNESGKSNILRAVSFLDVDVTPIPDDVRDSLAHEGSIAEAYIRFVFRLSKDDCDTIYEQVQHQALTLHPKSKIVTTRETKLDLKGFCHFRNEGLYMVDLLTKKKDFRHWRLPDSDNSVESHWKMVSKTCPDSAVVEVDDGQVKLKSYKLVNTKDFPDLDESWLEDLQPSALNNIVGAEIIELVEKEMPNCIFWEYSDANLLPARVDLATFQQNPSSCMPLKHMFHLADHDDINQAIQDAKARSNGMRNLLNKVAKKATEHIRSIWVEKKDITISLAQNGNAVEAGVEDSCNVFNFARRSDGFKRFITFLLMVSAPDRTDNLNDSVIIIDEPDVGLHPSGSRYLREELIKLSKRNIVVYSTHSIFMIDRNNTDRHLLLTKKDEVTHCEVANESNIKDEEVIFNALGYSTFEALQKQNIIFEGWCDKQLFAAALQNKTLASRTAKKLRQVGFCHAYGVKDIGRVSAMLDLANREYIVVSDNDLPAKEKKKVAPVDLQSRWYMYEDLLEDAQVLTSEDFIKPSCLVKVFNKTLEDWANIDRLTDETLSFSNGAMPYLNAHLVAKRVPKETIKDIIRQFKSDLFSCVSANMIEDKYYDFLETVTQKL